jgi:hypothetical protein
VDVVIAAYLREGLQVETDLRSASFARLDVRSAAESAKIELGLDRRKNEPIRLAAGPVLHADDAVANKICALSDGLGSCPPSSAPGRFGITPIRRRDSNVPRAIPDPFRP